jgi:hypothetical protein
MEGPPIPTGAPRLNSHSVLPVPASSAMRIPDGKYGNLIELPARMKGIEHERSQGITSALDIS